MILGLVANLFSTQSIVLVMMMSILFISFSFSVESTLSSSENIVLRVILLDKIVLTVLPN